MKSGIDYFPLDVALDSKFELIEAEFGLTGFGVIVHLLQEIYGKAGYYIEWTQEVALLFARKMGLGGSVVSEIIEASIRRGMFDREIYDKYRILTSRGIQRRYFEAVSRRKSLKVDFNILLINVAQICPNANIQTENVCISIGNVNISEQSKVEKSRVKKSILSCPSAAPTDDGAEADSFARFWALYPRHDKRRDAEKAWNTLKAWKDPDLLAAILSAVERAKSSRQWQEEGGRYIPLPASWLRGARWEDKGVVTGATAASETEAAVRDLLT